MKLVSVKVRNFRRYREETILSLDNLTAIVGRNDSGKSTFLEALEIFFNNNLVKIERGDCSSGNLDTTVRITCVFDVQQGTINPVTGGRFDFQREYLLNTEGQLEITKEYDCTLKAPSIRVYINANYPTNTECYDLYSLDNKQLKQRTIALLPHLTNVRLSSNSDMRISLYDEFASNLMPQPTQLCLTEGARSSLWSELEPLLPEYVLFQSDRTSTDQDDEIQDPMKLAVGEAFKDHDVIEMLNQVKQRVKDRATELAHATLEKLTEMHPELGSGLNPVFKAEPKWETLFKIGLYDQDNIPINKKGGGTRRLILINFLRAMAEQTAANKNGKTIIYAIEEPETAQHPDNQKRIIEAFMNLSMEVNRQIIITTHVPGLAGLIPVKSLRFVDRENTSILHYSIENEESEKVLQKISERLGVFANHNLKVLIFVEGPNDVNFMVRVANILRQEDESLPDLTKDKSIAIIPTGGSTLQQWIDQRYLRHLQVKEVHIYDRDDAEKPKYQGHAQKVNSRHDGSIAFITTKRELENYIHPAALGRVLKGDWDYTSEDDVPTLVEKSIKSKRKEVYKRLGTDKAKVILNTRVVDEMTLEELKEMDPEGEIRSWMQAIQERLK